MKEAVDKVRTWVFFGALVLLGFAIFINNVRGPQTVPTYAPTQAAGSQSSSEPVVTVSPTASATPQENNGGEVAKNAAVDVAMRVAQTALSVDYQVPAAAQVQLLNNIATASVQETVYTQLNALNWAQMKASHYKVFADVASAVPDMSAGPIPTSVKVTVDLYQVKSSGGTTKIDTQTWRVTIGQVAGGWIASGFEQVH
jgi:hypothetical protein